ncbi:MAG: hypothetical protein JNL38_22450 [Myxococcales bacterium]|nr:hypothetical protein [Myxococcales bacterium]
MSRSTSRGWPVAAILLLGAAGAIALVYAAAAALGLEEHVTVVVGMPRSPWSVLLGPLYLAARLGATLVAPALAIAGVLDLALHVARARRSGVGSST